MDELTPSEITSGEGSLLCICTQCGAGFGRKFSQIRDGRGIHCSTTCRSSDTDYQIRHNEALRKMHADPKYQSSRKMMFASPDWISHNLEANRAMTQSPEWIVKNKAHLQKLHADPAYQEKKRVHMQSPDFRAKMSICINNSQRCKDAQSDPNVRKKKSISHMGLKNHKYIDGRTPLYEGIRNLFWYSLDRENAFKRENYTCQNCGDHGGNLHAHHIHLFSEILDENNIKSYEGAERCAELRDLSNLFVVCEECHRNIHTNNQVALEEC